MAARTGPGAPGATTRPAAGVSAPGNREVSGQPVTAVAGRASPKARRKPGKSVVVAVAAVVVLAAVGGFAYTRMGEARSAREVPSISIAIGEFTTNLADADQRRVIQIDIALDVAGPDGEAAVKDHMPAVQDAVNRAVRAFTAAELQGPEGMDRLRAALQRAIDGAAGVKVVRAVYFTRIVIQ